MAPTISIVASMHNRKQQTLDIVDKLFLPSILKNATKDMQFILIDDQSPMSVQTKAIVDKHAPMLKKRLGQFLFVKNKTNLGFAKSYNRGMSLSKAPLLLVTNDDVYFPQGSIEKLARAANDDKHAGVVGPVTNCASAYQNTQLFKKLESYAKPEIDRIEKFSQWLSQVMHGKTYSVKKLIGFCVVYKRDILDKTGLYDTKYIYGNAEDDDLHHRIVKQGYDLKLIGDIFVEHGGISGGHASIKQRPLHMARHYVLNCLKFGISNNKILESIWIAYIRNPVQERGFFTITKEIEKNRKLLGIEKF